MEGQSCQEKKKKRRVMHDKKKYPQRVKIMTYSAMILTFYIYILTYYILTMPSYILAPSNRLTSLYCCGNYNIQMGHSLKDEVSY